MFLGDLANVNTATTGTGTITLGAAVAGYQSFAASGVVSGDWVQYRISDGASAWEIGWGLYVSTGPSLTRNLVQSSTGALLSLSGTATVFVDAGAATLLMPYAPLFGTGADGSLSSGFGSISLTRDTCYGNIVFGASDSITTNGWVLCAQSCDLGAASAGAIIAQSASSLAGNAGSATAQGSTLSALSNVSAGAGGNGAAGGAGGAAAGSGGSAGVGMGNTVFYGFGGKGGQNTATNASGGSGASGGGGNQGGSLGSIVIRTPIPTLGRFVSGSNTLYPYLLSSGGGGGGSGSGGGAVYVVCGARIGGMVTGGLDASAGNGAAGGAGIGSGIGGTGGGAGFPGGIELINIAAGTYAATAPTYTNSPPATASTSAGTAGGVAAATQQNL